MRPGKVFRFRRAFCFNTVASESSGIRCLQCYDAILLSAKSSDPDVYYHINACNLYTNGMHYPPCFTIFEQIDY